MAALFALLVAAAGVAQELTPIRTSASDASMTPFLSGNEHGLYLSWLERTADGHELRVARLDDGGTTFTTPHTIHRSERFFANWADFASVLVLPSGRLAAHWLEKSAKGTYDYDVWVAFSDDEGVTWSEPEKPHRDGTHSEHGFVSLVPDGADGVAAIWLDGREMARASDDAAKNMTLRFGMSDGQQFGQDVLLDGRVCECCQTGMARVGEELFVVYRDRSDEEIRDIGFVRTIEGEWTEPETFHADGWPLDGCPVNGPQVAASGQKVAAAWFTAASDDPRVLVRFSDDGGASFGAPVRVDDGAPVGRVDVEWDGNAVYVSWLESREGKEGEVRVKRVASSGELGAPLTVARTASGRASGFARLARFRGELYVTWTESASRSGPSRIHVAKLAHEKATDFQATDLDGNEVRLSALSGKVVLVNFWGIWCKACRQEIPHLVELDKAWRDEGLVVLGADSGDEVRDLPPFVEDIGMTYPVLIDDGLADVYDVLVFPTSIVIDREGRIRHRVEGYTEAKFRALQRTIEELLHES